MAMALPNVAIMAIILINKSSTDIPLFTPHFAFIFSSSQLLKILWEMEVFSFNKEKKEEERF